MARINPMTWEGAGFLTAMQELKARCEYTPDIHEIEKFTEYIPILEFGIHKNYGFATAPIFKDSKFLGDAVTMNDSFAMYEAHGYPHVFRTRIGDPTSKRILGQLFAVPIATLLTLDRTYHNNIMVMREQVHVKLLDQIAPIKQNKVARPIIEALMYVTNSSFYNENKFTKCPHKLYNQGSAYFYAQQMVH